MKNNRTISRIFSLLFLICISFFSHAATHLVLTTTDSGAGSLRTLMNASLPGDTILFDNSTNGSPIYFFSPITIDTDIVIIGNGIQNTIFDGRDSNQLFLISLQDTVRMSNLTLTHGNGNTNSSHGGAIRNSGNLFLSFCLFENNNSPWGGGALSNIGYPYLIFTEIDHCTFRNNYGLVGGAIEANSSVNFQVRSSTFNGNHGSSGGGAIYIEDPLGLYYNEINNCTIVGNFSDSNNQLGGGGILSSSSLNLFNSTVAFNTSGNEGGGIYVNNVGNLLFINNIIANNIAQNSANDVYAYQPYFFPDCSNNLIEDVTGFPMPTGNGNIFNADPLLSSLNNNGGPTETVALTCKSPAIGGGIIYGNGAMDQRGVTKIGLPEIGACEYDFGQALSVTNSNDSGIGSLRDAILNACGGDTIKFDNSTNGVPITLGSPLQTNRHVIILGNGIDNTFLDGNNQTFICFNSDTANSYFQDLTFENGNNVMFEGGAIYNSGTLHLKNCELKNNYTIANGGALFNSNTLNIDHCNFFDNYGTSGGAICSYSGTMTIANSTIKNNQADIGGGIYSGGKKYITNSTISGNRANNGSGGGIWNLHEAIIMNCTIADNFSLNNGGGIFNYNFSTEKLKLVNSLIARNRYTSGSSDVYNSGLLDTASRNNLIGDNTGLSLPATNGNILNVDPFIDSLRNNGGRGMTHALQCGSLAIDAADNLLAPSTDQRNVVRMGQADIGAYEFTGANLSVNVSGSILMADQPNAQYQWIDCNNNLPIPGQTNQSFDPTTNGNYAVIIFINTCIDTSTCYNVTTAEVSRSASNSNVDLFPNPAHSVLNIQLNQVSSVESIIILSVTGKIIRQTNFKNENQLQLNISDLENGFYLLQLNEKNKKEWVKFVKE